jgi:aldose 1-epimerase
MKTKVAVLILIMVVAMTAPGGGPLGQERTMAAYVEIKREQFQKDVDGKRVDLYTLRNGNGMVVKITNQGAKIVQLLVPDRNNQLGDVVLGYDTLDQFMAGLASMGAIIGRFPNHLHGGKGTQFQVFGAKQLDERTLQLTYFFKDGEEGYPGTTSLKVVYAVTDDNELRITYDAVTDKPTVVNFTNHAFFNLTGEGRGDILGHELTINADRFTPIDDTSIPTGELRSVRSTPIDFTRPQRIGARINDDDQQLKYGTGYDHNYVLNKSGGELSFAARLYDPESGRMMEVYTTEPGMQVYTGNFLAGKPPLDRGKAGKLYGVREAICLETQHFPDSPNQGSFPTTVLNPGQWFTSTTIYKFSPRFPAKGN